MVAQLNQYVYFKPVTFTTYAEAFVHLAISSQTADGSSIKLSDNSTPSSKGGIAPFDTEIYSFSWQVCPAAIHFYANHKHFMQ